MVPHDRDHDPTVLDQTKLAAAKTDAAKIEAAITTFSRFLDTPWSRQRTPKGYDSALASARSNPECTEGIFLAHGGVAAFLAYFLATNGKCHFQGQHAQAQTVGDFLKLSVESHKMVAQRVGEKRRHQSVQDAIDGFSKRARTTLANNEKNREQSRSKSPIPSNPQSSQANTDVTPDYVPTVQHKQFSNASPQATSRFFPPYMHGAIRKDSVDMGGMTCVRAAITMLFPVDPVQGNDCVMTLVILKNKVEHCAKTLFGVQVESTAQVRYVVYPNGVTAVRGPEITLIGCRKLAIAELFGAETNRAVDGSQYREREQEEQDESAATGCVTMAITSNPEEGAFITLYLGLSEASEIRNKLFI